MPENKSIGSGGGECVITTAATSPWAFAYSGGGGGEGHADGEIYSVAKAVVVVVSAVASFKFKGGRCRKTTKSFFQSPTIRPQLSYCSRRTIVATTFGLLPICVFWISHSWKMVSCRWMDGGRGGMNDINTSKDIAGEPVSQTQRDSGGTTGGIKAIHSHRQQCTR